ncbi:MAG: hypothetical protein ACOYM8_10740 [Caulobacterales bacterium]
MNPWLLVAGAVFGAVSSLILAFCEPNAGIERAAERYLKSVGQAVAALPKRPTTVDATRLIDAPVLSIAVDPSALTPIVLLGTAITPARRAALVSVAGAPPLWLQIGDHVRDMTLVSLDHATASFETPFGVRTVALAGSPDGSRP